MEASTKPLASFWKPAIAVSFQRSPMRPVSPAPKNTMVIPVTTWSARSTTTTKANRKAMRSPANAAAVMPTAVLSPNSI